jgi:electron transport complex protein RnfG
VKSKRKEKPIFEHLKMISTLVIIAAISGGVLASIYSVTKEKIELQGKNKLRKAIFSILPQTTYIEEVKLEKNIVYKCKDDNGKVKGLAFVAEGPGYQDVIKVLVVTNTDLSIIKGIEILENVETPGLGAKITEDEFKEQFKNTSSFLKLSKESSEKGEKRTIIQAITGATISSQAVVDIINSKIEEIKKSL